MVFKYLKIIIRGCGPGCYRKAECDPSAHRPPPAFVLRGQRRGGEAHCVWDSPNDQWVGGLGQMSSWRKLPPANSSLTPLCPRSPQNAWLKSVQKELYLDSTKARDKAS